MRSNMPHAAPSALSTALILACVYLAGTLAAGLAWNFITPLPFSNPHDIVSLLAREGYNPANDFVRFSVFMLAPSLLLAALCLFDFAGLKSRLDGLALTDRLPGPGALPLGRNKGWAAFLLLFAFVFAFNLPTHCIGLRDAVDQWHEGEYLAPAVFMEKGQVPYKDFIILHGPIQDPLRALAGFKLLGRSIGSARAVTSALKMLLWVLLAALMLVLFKGDVFYAFAAMVVVFIVANLDRNSLLKLQNRDITVILFIMAASLARERLLAKPSGRETAAWGFALGFFALFGFYYSLERGVYMTACWIVLAPWTWFAFVRGTGRSAAYWAGSLLGAAAGFAPLAVFLGGNLGPYFEFAFSGLPGYVDLATAWIYDITHVYGLVALALLAGNLFFLCLLAVKRIREAGSLGRGAAEFLRLHMTEFVLVAMTTFMFRNALCRSHSENVAGQIGLCYVTTLYLVAKFGLGRFKPNRWARLAVMLIVPLALMGLTVQHVVAHTKWDKYFPVHTTDNDLFRPDYRQALDYLRQNLGPNDTVYPLTSEGLWYYMLDRPAPTRFPLLWTAPTREYQQQVIADLERSKPKFVIYTNDMWTNEVDGIPHREMFPLVFAYVHQHYAPDQTIGKNEIWKRVE